MTVSGRMSPKDGGMREYAPLTQSVQVTFVGTFGTEPPSAMVVTMDLMFVTMGLTFVNDIVPVCGSRSSSVSVTHRARCRCSCCAGGGRVSVGVF